MDRDGQIVDAGELDKRCQVITPEFAAILPVITRHRSTLSSTLRDAWGRPDLRVTTKNQPLRATHAHISLIAHITEAELRRELTDTEALIGFGNRSLWVRVRRSRLLPEPEPEPLDGYTVAGLAREVDGLSTAPARSDASNATTTHEPSGARCTRASSAIATDRRPAGLG